LGDGAALYRVQGLRTAAHHHIPVTFISCNNAQYKIFKVSGDVMQSLQRNYLARDLVEPEVDFVNLARSLGVQARRVSTSEDLSAGMDDALNRTEPLLLDLSIER
jgi:benzoylformate decarboxylase